MEIDKRGHRKHPFPLLVVENNKDHQLIIGYCLRANIPQAEPIFATTAKEAKAFLQLSFAQRKTFPQLMLLDPFLPNLTKGFGLLTELRTAYPLLPIVILSHQQDQQLVNESYQRGAHSVIIKSTGLASWEQQFQRLKDYWLDVVSLPKKF